MIEAAHPANADQIAYWNGLAARHWTERQHIQDFVLAPVTERLFEAAKLQPGERVIDIGCGCGDTTLLAAGAVGPSGKALGIDVSELMLSRARARAALGAANVEFRLADASAIDFSGENADLLMSRFGVMFFADPAATFANLRRALKAGGRLAFACWREPKFNPWLMTPFQAMRHRAPPQPERKPEDPGPFAFADAARVRQILGSAGFGEISIDERSMQLDIAVGRGLETAVGTALAIGPVARALDGQGEDVWAAAAGDVRAALAPHVSGDNVMLDASVWIVTAMKG